MKSNEERRVRLEVVFVVTPMYVDTKWGKPVVFKHQVDAEQYAKDYSEAEKIRCDVEMCAMWISEEGEKN